jgi:molybdopterin biosynthesis enzyme
MPTNNYKPTPWKVTQNNLAALHARINKLQAEVNALKFAAMTPQELEQLAANLADNDAFCATLRCNK